MIKASHKGTMLGSYGVYIIVLVGLKEGVFAMAYIPLKKKAIKASKDSGSDPSPYIYMSNKIKHSLYPK